MGLNKETFVTPTQIIRLLLTDNNIHRELATKPAGGWGEDWGLNPARAPVTQPTDVVIARLPGRVLNKIDYRSHYFVVTADLVQQRTHIYVAHGAGQESFQISPYVLRALPFLPTEKEQYLLVHGVYSAVSSFSRSAAVRTRWELEDAYLSGRMRKHTVDGKTSMVIDSVEEHEQRQASRAKRKERGKPKPTPAAVPEVERAPVMIDSGLQPFL